MSDWEYTVIEEVPKELLDEREIYWIAFYNSNDPKHGYNMATGGDRHDGYKLSEETCRKLSVSHKGKPSWMKGKTHSVESRRKISESMKGKPSGMKGKTHSEETRKKIGDSQRGKKISYETRKKMSEAKKGNTWNKGKIRSAETRRKISESKNPNRIAIYQNDTLITICDTVKEAACLTDVSHSYVRLIASGKWSKTKSGYSFKYISKSS